MANPREPAWNDKVKTGNLMARVLKHANGEIEMTATQLKAADLFLRKTVPDLSRSELTGRDGGAIVTESNLTEVDKQILAQFKGGK